VKPPRATTVLAVGFPLLALAWALLPVLLGSETFFLRDLFAAQLSLREELADGLAAGRLPLVDAHRLGQPLAGNPNAVAFYPTALLHAVAPLFWAFDAHLWLHLFAAPFAFAWLARELGLARRAAWAAGVCFAFSGYLASQLAFLNLIAGVTLAPALAAAVLGTLARARRGRRRAAATTASAAGLLWGLVLLGGDPMTAVLAAALAGAVAVPELAARWREAAGGVASGADGATPAPERPRGRLRLRRLAPGLALLAVALVAGTFVALPQIVELLRILPASARGQRGFAEGVRLAGSLDPRQAIEWLIPFAFGRPDLLGPGSFWGYRLYQGSWAFLYTLYPGLAALALVAAAGAPWRRAAPVRPEARRTWLVGAALAAAGAFLALGAFNPLAVRLLTLPVLDVLRFPSKTWLLAAVGLSLAAGVGFERALVGGEPAARRRAVATLLGLGALLAGLWTALTLMPEAAAQRFLTAMPEGAPPALAVGEVVRWAGLAVLSLAVAAALLLCLLLAARRPRLAGALVLALHAATQLWFLAPVRATDAVVPYTLPSRLLTALPADETIVHGAAQNLFGEGALRDGTFPEPLARWIFRRGWHELYPMGGGLWDRRYHLVTSPEALDPLPTRQAFAAVEEAPDDPARLRLLAAWGAERLVLDRPLEGEVAPLATPVVSAPSFRERIWVYRLTTPAPPVYLAARVTTTASARTAARRMASPTWQIGEEAVVVTRGPAAPPEGTLLPGLVEKEAVVRAGEPKATPAPRVRVLTETAETLLADIDSPAGGLLVWRQAWLPIYRATLDGRPAPTLAANIHHLAVPIPPGPHRLHLTPNRHPLHLSLTLAALALLTLLLLPLWPRFRR
jgi:hypothetical protein